MRNAGSVRLARTGATQAQIASRLGCTQQAAQQWISGATRPSKVRRGELRAAFEIPVEAWDEEVPSSVSIPNLESPAPAAAHRERSTPPPARSPLPSSALGKMEIVEATLMEQMDKVRQDPLSTPAEICKVGRDCMGALDIIAKRRGEGGIDMPKWLRSPEWAKILKAIGAALDPYPEAALRFAEEMRRAAEEAE